MGLFKIVVCDDDASFAENLHKKISGILLESNISHHIVELYDGSELLDYCRQNAVDIVFADIEMPKMTGFESVRKLQEYQTEITIVFITAHEEFAYQAYDYHPYQFISKNDLGKLDMLVKRLAGKIVSRKQCNEVTHIRLGHNIIDIQVTEVMYFKSKRNYVLAYYLDGSQLKFRANLKSIYEQLCNVGFIQIHRSYVVNCRFIFDFSTSKVLLKDHTEISVTRNADMRKEAQRIYGKFQREIRW